LTRKDFWRRRISEARAGDAAANKQFIVAGGKKRLAQPDTPTKEGRATLPVCPNLTASKRSDAGGTMAHKPTPEHRSARSGGSLGGAAAPPYLCGGAKIHPEQAHFCFLLPKQGKTHPLFA
jgi:hypothetical protein